MNVTTIDVIEKHDHKDPVEDAKFEHLQRGLYGDRHSLEPFGYPQHGG
jgi:hypothetical protein